MSTSEDSQYFEIVNATVIAPMFFYLSLVLFTITVYSVFQSAAHPNDLVLGCLTLILGYNSFRFGRKLKSGAGS